MFIFSKLRLLSRTEAYAHVHVVKAFSHPWNSVWMFTKYISRTRWGFMYHHH